MLEEKKDGKEDTFLSFCSLIQLLIFTDFFFQLNSLPFSLAITKSFTAVILFAPLLLSNEIIFSSSSFLLILFCLKLSFKNTTS